ncbi:Dopey, N-terminal-domain-containing protein [Flammula alnicola]|nr:Dopey, N-terminal-domain-containing protein [Flammula alnicola]
MSTNAPLVSGIEGSGKVAKKGSAWVSARTSERSIALQTYSSDPKYKKYVQQVEKCLNSFDNVHEWADCIAFLKQLLKTFQSYMQFKEIPRKLIVAKRLAQCLNPALPTGVHQRALEVYVHILAVLGVEGLKRDLSFWSSGLFPFFEYAATSVKPTLLNIYDTHYLPLQTGLRPIMKSFILALLPGLEEETGEFFEKVLSLLDRVSGAVSVSFFFQNIWLIMLTTPSARGTSLNFLARRLPRLNADEDFTEVVGKDIGLMIHENLLVRRAALDILHAIRKAHNDDRSILMRAATGVVLRRDLSLNRRLYTWLLGPDENSDHQIAYLKENALTLLSSTLKNEMISPSGEYAESRPFKIFISLLDKWEIGAILTESLVYDAFKAIMNLVKNPTESGEDLTMTASTLYEAVEPQILWQHLLTAVFNEIMGDGTQIEAIQLVNFIIQTFSHDEEVQTIHLPIIFTAIVDLINSQIQSDPTRASLQSVGTTLLLLEDMLLHIPHSSLMQWPETTLQLESGHQRPFDFACTFFKITDKTLPTTTTSQVLTSTVPFVSCFHSLVSLSISYADRLFNEPQNGFVLRESFCRLLTLIDRLVARLTAPINISWDPTQCLDILLATLEHQTATFTTVDRLITLVTAFHRNQYLEPKFIIDGRSTMYKMVSKLLHYLHPDFTAYHVRAVNLIWTLQGSTAQSHVESILAQSMTSPESRNVSEAYEAFGVLWRLTEDNLFPGFYFKIPMMIVLDTLKSDKPNLRRVGETWMRCSLKSYIRVLDPILYDLLDPSILRTPITFKVRGRELPGFQYERPFDQRIINHLLDTLLSIVNFGGQGFAKAARTTSIKRSHHSGLAQRVFNSNLVDSEASYLDILLEILLRFVQSESISTRTTLMQPLNTAIQSNAIELLQVIVARGEIDSVLVESIEATAVGKLYFSIHTNRLDLQNKWLHLLHSVISVSTSHLESSRAGASTQDDNVLESGNLQEKAADSAIRYPLNPLLVQTLVDGISTRTNRPVLQHWLDFILMAVPQFQPALQAVVAPLNDCLCRQLLSSLGDVLRATAQIRDYAEDTPATVTDAELIMLLNALERLILLSLAYTAEMDTSEDDLHNVDKTTSEASGLLGYVSNVFSSDTSTSQQIEQLTSRSPGYRSLDEGIRVLYSLWASLAWKAPQPWTPKDDSLSLIYTRTRLRCRRVLEHLFRVQSAEVFESIVDWWSRDLTLSATSPDAAFDLVDVLVSNAQTAVHMICESITFRILGSSEKSKKQAINPNLTDTILFKFLEQYLTRLEGPLAIQVWSRYIQLVKEILGASREFKIYNFPALRCLGVLAEKITQTTAMDDRKIRKELQESYGKLLDSCVIYVGRFTDQGSWIRRSTKESVINSGRESPAPRADATSRPDEKLEAIGIPLETPKLGSLEVVGQINSFVATSALPNLRKALMENDKIISACNNIIYYIVNPALRGKTRPMDVDATVIQILQEMTRIPAALKSWRTPVIDLLNDNRLFNCNPNDAAKWRSIVKALYDSDKTALPELLGKLANAPSANIFTNREYEMLLRSLNLRRLSYILFTGEKNHFLTQLPTIQEKLVDIFRSVSSPVVQSEVFLCIRVLLCRLSPHNLTSFWPVVLTEMYRIFEQSMTTLPADGSEDLQLVLAACKCLDTLLVLQTEEFQIHQWIFITDTVDAVYRPDDWYPEAMMDQLSEIAGNLPTGESSSTNHIEQPSPPQDQRAMRRPMLGSLRQIESMRDLLPFFSNISISSYESVYASGGNIDWEAVERSIMDDMFDGR